MTTSFLTASWLVHSVSEGREIGRLSAQEIVSDLQNNRLNSVDLVWTEGLTDWLRIHDWEQAILAELRGEGDKPKTEHKVPDGASKTVSTLSPEVAEKPEQEINDHLGGFSHEESGTISFWHPSKKEGTIAVEGKGQLRFFRDALPIDAPRELVGSKVSALVKASEKGPIATAVNILAPPTDIELSQSIETFQQEISALSRQKIRGRRSPGTLITRWSNLAVDPVNVESDIGRQMRDHMPELATLALGEPWCFEYDKGRDDYSILRKYIKYTFYRTFQERKIAFSKTHATFNTGLVDELFEPIYALFARNTRLGSRPYRFVDFCVVGDQGSGKELMSRFSLPERPEPAQYIKNFDEVIFDPRCPVSIQPTHVIDDAILKGRYPLEFLLKHMPTSMRQRGEPNIKDKKWLEAYVDSLNESPQKRRAFASDLRYAVEFARKRARWNYKTAIPNYFPTLNKMSLLLPLALLDDSKPDMAIVCNRVNQFEYYGITVYPLDMAYESARLVCRPLSDWLTPEIAQASEVEEDGVLEAEDESEEEDGGQASIG
jgi:hypothetical protein